MKENLKRFPDSSKKTNYNHIVPMITQKRIHIYSTGCTENKLDSAYYKRFFEKNGWLISEDYSTADIILLNTCVFKKSAVDSSLEIIKKLKAEKKPNAELIVCGCLPNINPEKLKTVFEGPTFSPITAYKLEQIVKAKGPLSDMNDPNEIYENTINQNQVKNLKTKIMNSLKRIYSPAFQAYDSNLCYITVATGCLGNCSYCGIKKARGRLKSRPPKNIFAEFNNNLKEGNKTFVLCGTDVGAYGKDIGISVITLLQELFKTQGDYKLVLRNFEPRWLPDILQDFIPILKSNKIISITIPFQSGSNRILRLMNRSYEIEELKSALKKIRRANPLMLMLTHVLVGFPGETKEDFELTMEFLDKVDFDHVQINIYENHPSTKACYMKNQVPDVIKKERYDKLNRKCKIVMFNSFITRRFLNPARSFLGNA